MSEKSSAFKRTRNGEDDEALQHPAKKGIVDETKDNGDVTRSSSSSSWMGKEFCDFISNLQNRTMLASCAQDILGLLDDKTLFAADEVSELWREAIIDGQLLQKRLKQKVACEPYWKKLCNILRALGLFSDSTKLTLEEQFKNHKKLFCFFPKTIEDNWKNALYKQEEWNLESDKETKFTMSDNIIVRYSIPEKCFKLFWRWTLGFIMNIPTENYKNDLAHPMLKVRNCIELKNDSLFAPYAYGVVVWNIWIKSFEVLRDYEDYMPGSPRICRITNMCVSPTGNTLATITSVKQQHHYMMLLTIRKRTESGTYKVSEERELSNSSIVPKKFGKRFQLYLDNKYLVLVDRTLAVGSQTNGTCRVIELENVLDPSKDRPFPIPCGNGYSSIVNNNHHSSNYSDGLFAFVDFPANSGDFGLNLLDVRTSLQVRKLFPLPLKEKRHFTINLVSGKFVVGHYSLDKSILVWSVEELWKLESTPSSALLHSLDLEKPFKCLELIADEYQVLIFGVKREVEYERKPYVGPRGEKASFIKFDFVQGQDIYRTEIPTQNVLRFCE